MRDPDRIIETVRPELEALESRRQDLLAERTEALKKIAKVAAGIAAIGAPVVYLVWGSPLWVVPVVLAVAVGVVMAIVTIANRPPASRRSSSWPWWEASFGPWSPV